METRFYNAKLIKAAKIFHRGLPGPKSTVDHKAKELKNKATLVKKKKPHGQRVLTRAILDS